MKRAGLIVAALLAGAAAVVVGVGWILPVEHVASARVTLARPPADVFAQIADVVTYPRWWPDMTAVERLPPVEGRPRFRQHMDSGAVIVEVVETAPPTRFVTRIADPDQPFGGTWTIDVAPANGGSAVTVTERGEVYNPVFRFLSHFVFGHEATIRSFLSALQATP